MVAIDIWRIRAGQIDILRHAGGGDEGDVVGRPSIDAGRNGCGRVAQLKLSEEWHSDGMRERLVEQTRVDRGH